jgi:hypothetical protein
VGVAIELLKAIGIILLVLGIRLKLLVNVGIYPFLVVVFRNPLVG